MISSSGEVTAPLFISSALMATTDPLKSSFLTEPYPMTTTSSNCFESSFRTTFICAAAGNSCVLYPMKEMTIMSPCLACNLNFPSRSVMVPLVVPLTTTFAPITPSPVVPSWTSPLTDRFCATACTVNIMATKNSSIILPGSFIFFVFMLLNKFVKNSTSI